MSVARRTVCPSCRSKGNDKKGNNLVHFDDGGAYCFACEHTEIPEEGYQPEVKDKDKPPYQLPRDLTYVELKDRLIPKDVCKLYNVGVDAHGMMYFPVYNKERVICGAKVRPYANGDLVSPSGDSPKYRWDYGSHASEAMPFGWHLFKREKPTIHCTGETDTLAAFTQLKKQYNVLGSVLGEQGWPKLLRRAANELVYSKKHVVIGDNDAAGKEAIDKVVKALPPDNVRVLTPPIGYKDASDLHVNGLLRGLIDTARDVAPEGIQDAHELYQELLNDFYGSGGNESHSFGLPGFDYLTGGIAPGKVITLAGDTGLGKTRFSQYLAYGAVKQGMDVLFIPLEMTTLSVAKQMLEVETRMRMFYRPRETKPDLPVTELEKAYWALHEKLHYVKNFGTLSEAELKRRIDVAVCKWPNTKLVVLDHLTAAVTNSGGIDWGIVDSMMYALKELAIKRNVCILAISHINTPEKGKAYQKDEDGDDIRIVQLHEMRGSRAIEQCSDMVAAISRVRGKETSWLYTLKQDRFVGVHVAPFELGYNWNRFHFDERVQNNDELIEEVKYAKAHMAPRAEVQERVREGHLRDEPSTGAEVRAPETGVARHQEVHPRLPAPQRDTSGGEGTVFSRRPKETTRRHRPAPRARLAPPPSET